MGDEASLSRSTTVVIKRDDVIFMMEAPAETNVVDSDNDGTGS